MELINYYVLYILASNFRLASAKAQYYITQQNTTAADAAKECQLASPPVIYSKGGNTVDINLTEIQGSYQLTTGGAYWVGYVEKLVYFLYKGCALPHNLISTTTAHMIEDPGQCYSKCKSNFIGIQETTCHCLKSLPSEDDLFEPGCILSCTSPTGVLCGGVGHVSVYLKVQPFASDTFLNNSCLTFNPRENGIWAWRSCSGRHNGVCQAGCCPVYTTLPWSRAMQQCLIARTPLSNASNNRKTQQTHWTAAIRSYSVSNIRDKGQNVYGVQPGYVEMESGRLWLKFGGTDPETKKYSICQNPSSVGWGQKSTSREYRYYTTIQTAADKDTKTMRSKGSHTVVWYTTIPISLVVIAAVVVFILWRRGILKACKYTDSGICRKTLSTTANPALEGKPQSDAVQQDYLVLEPLGEYAYVNEYYKHGTNKDYHDKATRFPKIHDINKGNYDIATRSPNGHDANEDNYDKATRFANNHGTNENTYDRAAEFTNELDKGSDDYDNLTNTFSKLPRNNMFPNAYSSLDNLGSYDRSNRFPNRHYANGHTYYKSTGLANNHGTNENTYDRAAEFTNELDKGSDDYDNPTNSFSKLPRNNISPNACSSLDNLGSYDHIVDFKRAAAKSDDYYRHLETKKDENTYDTSSSSST